MNVRLSEDTHKVIWNIVTKGLFPVKSLYQFLKLNSVPFTHKFIWKVKVSLLDKDFLMVGA